MSFLYNSWYCAGWGADLKDKPIGIRICDREIVIYRKEDGTPVAMDGICPHRFAPLSRGKVRGDEIECCYHGLRFGSTGECTHNPHGRGIKPARARLGSYPTSESRGALWVWMGEPGNADPSTIIDFDFVEDTDKWTSVTGYLKIQANYQLVIDNLLDLTHATYLHPETVGLAADITPEMEFLHEFKTEGATIHSNYTVHNSLPTPLFEPFMSYRDCSIYSYMRWEPASSLILDISTTRAGCPKDTGIHLPSAHLLVPETEDTCHYFYALSRSVERDSEEHTNHIKQLAVTAFVEEDAPVIRDCYAMMDGQEFFDMKPVILETDRAAIQARRLLGKLLSDEQESTRAN